MNTLALHFSTLFVRNERFSLMSLGAVTVLAVVAMGLASLAVLNGKATKGYLLNQLEDDRQALVVDGEVTDMLILRARSLTTIEQRSAGMVKPVSGDIAYITPIQAVAQR